ncbi:MAG: RT0821/Lpp0805 family surface protein [Burkholderiales bacterium]
MTPAVVAVLVSLALVPVPSPAEPPPHAKAHGWRKKNDPNYVGYTGKKWPKDYGVVEGRCNTAAVGAAIGGVVGGVVGAKVSSQEDRPVAIILGAAIGAVVGHAIGKELDDADRACMGHALELAGERKAVTWTNKATGVTYRLTPTGSFSQGKTPCRRFTTVLTSGKKRDTVKGAACRQGNGEWVFRS